MLKLRTILFYNFFYYFLLILVLISVFLRVNIKEKSRYSLEDKKCEGVIVNYVVDGNKLSLWIKNKETVIGNYYFKSEQEKKTFLKTSKLGFKIKAWGNFKEIPINRTKYLFNYRNYLYHQKIYYLLDIDSYKMIKRKSFYYDIKNIFKKRIKSNVYLNTFILGDKSYISKNVLTSYQENGIAHLFAISGMHISLISAIGLKLLKKVRVKDNTANLIMIIFLLGYLLIANFSASILRGVLFFIFFTINKKYYFYIKTINIFLLTLSITLLLNPYFIFDVGFQYSFTISFFLLYLADLLKSNRYFIGLLKVSLLSFIVSLPITLYNFYQVNLMSIIYNLFYVPLISLVIFPFSLIVLLMPFLENIFLMLTGFLEKSSLFLSNISWCKFSFYRVNGLFYILYFIVIFFLFSFYKKKNNWRVFLILIVMLVVHYFFPYFKNDTFIKVIDVGQGDAILLYSKLEAILIDTGGISSYDSSQWQEKKNKYSIARGTIIPLLKSLGIRKLKWLAITHGDFDHIGEGKNIVENFEVEKVIINANSVNYYENELLKSSKGEIAKEGLVLKCGDIILVQLNKDLKEENDSSLIFLAFYKNTKILLMGDASKKSEEELLKNYEIGDVDILKVGHHGSKSSSSSEFLQAIKPKVSLISAGVDNKFFHPHKEVLERLKKYGKIYSTKQSGTITVNLKNLKVNIDIQENFR